MRWHDFDRNGRIDSRDYYIMTELLKEEKEKERDELFSEDEEGEDGEDDLW